ncbi:hypothetical protein NPX13_g4229 [Xylaria arbuscula]|uniref:Uncharacterized protein n=1 Tax=Xylaria arbuscula TaxID=114810 RepID=A0A9W8NFV6_9PEZI|nr:hypothetical protein NPX13_g4229 [Xylaria arbuscula]
MAKDTSTSNGLPREKRQTSLSSFISKLLPSHRREQGGTARDRHADNDSESAYRDLGINPNDLTEWNLPQDPPLRYRLPGQGARGPHPIDRDRPTDRGRSLQRDTTHQSSRTPRKISKSAFPWSPESLGEHPALKGSSGARTLPHKIPPITTNEIHDALKIKEAIRRNRRSLKESGDWLGVQGADPCSGEFAVLTPTSTLSSDATTPSARLRLAQLSERQKGAVAAYEKARLEEQEETERIMLQKGRLKLEKMEQAKEERRQSQQEKFPTWSKHRRRWSSVAEPGLSPIPQSIKSNKIDGSSSESIPIVSVRNFSRPSKLGGGSSPDEPRIVEAPKTSEGIISAKHDRRKDQSTETVIHQTLPSMKTGNMSLKSVKMFYPAVFSETSESPPDEQNKEKHFLWRRRRRMSDPGITQKLSKALMMHSSAKTEENLAFASDQGLPPLPRIGLQKPRDHFPGLPIPDPRLSPLPFTEPSMTMERLSMSMGGDPSPEIPEIPLWAQKRSTLRVATNHSDPPEIVLDTKEATVTLSQSKSKGNTTPPSTYRRVIPIRSSSYQKGAIPVHKSQIPVCATDQMRNRSDGSLPRNTAESQTVRDRSKVGKTSKADTLEDHIGINVSERRETDQTGFVSTPTIIITGFDRHHQDPSEDIQTHMGSRRDQKSSTGGGDKAPTTSSFPSGASASQERQSKTTPSRPTTPQSGWQNSELVHEIPEADTVSQGRPANTVLLGFPEILSRSV